MLTNESKNDAILTIGLDFGTTTSSAMVAKARIGVNCATGRMGFSSPEILYRSDPVFTPYTNGYIETDKIDLLLKQWLDESNIDRQQLFTGGVMITGLAAQNDNAKTIADHIRKWFGNIIVATADDPALESWLAFMGGTSVLSRFHHSIPMVNLDIGGGTTNPALGINGQVTATGCYFIGARHFQFIPGSRVIKDISKFGKAILESMGANYEIGDVLKDIHLEKILDFNIEALNAIVKNNHEFYVSEVAKYHQQKSFFINCDQDPVITFSGGVGEIIYSFISSGRWPETTCYGDLGVDLAQRIVADPVLSQHLDSHTPENKGRATVYGLTIHSTEISGTTLYLPDEKNIQISDLPIISRLSLNSDFIELKNALQLSMKSKKGACLQISALNNNMAPSLTEIKQFGEHMAQALEHTQFPPELPLVLLVPNDYGKAIGNYVSRWKSLPVNLSVIDEIPDRQASFVNIGAAQHHIIPVSFYGMQ